MNQFSILLIENNISVTADIVTTTSNTLTGCTLAIARNIPEAISENHAADMVLVDLALLGQPSQLDRLTENYSTAPLILLVQPNSAEAVLYEALQAGASDYVHLSRAGLLSFGRRLTELYNHWVDTKASNSFGRPVIDAINNDPSPLAIQLIDANDRVLAWNETMADLFKVPYQEAVGKMVKDLPLPAPDISRLKDLLDQARSTQSSFHVTDFALERKTTPKSKLTVHVFSFPRPPIQNSSLAVDVAIIISQPRYHTATLQHNRDLQVLLEASREISGQLELEPTLQKVIEQVNSLLGGDNSQIYFLDKGNTILRPVAALGTLADIIKTQTIPADEAIASRVITKAKSVSLPAREMTTHIPYPDDEYLMCAPLTAARGTIGMVIVSRQASEFTLDDLNFFESLVQQASAAINNGRMFEETQRSLNELAILYGAANAISTNWDNLDILGNLIQQVVRAINVSRGFIVGWQKDDNHGIIHAEYLNKKKYTGTRFKQDIDLTTRPILLKMLNQQRPVSLHLSAPSLDLTEQQEMKKHQAHSRLILPLIAKGETIGWIELWEIAQEHTFTADEVRLSRVLASQIAVALQNSQYLQKNQQTLEEATALYRVASALTILQDPQAIMSMVLQEYLQALNLKQGSVTLFDYSTRQAVVKTHIHDDTPNVVSSPGHAKPYQALEGQQIPLTNNPVYERLMRTRQAVLIDNPKAEWLTLAPRGVPNFNIPPVAGWGEERNYSILVIPIKIRGEISGAMVIENTRHHHPFTNWVISLGQAMADQLGVGLQNVQLYEAEYQRRQQAETLREVTSIVSSSLNLDEVLERILDQLRRVVQYDSAAIHLIEGNYRRVIAGRGFSEPNQHIGLRFPASEIAHDPGAVVISTGRPAVHANISKLYNSFNSEIHHHIKSWMGVPLIVRDNVIGLISIDHSEVDIYTEEDMDITLAFANQVAVAMENARLHEVEVRQFERELKMAHQIQETLLPREMPQVPGLDIAGKILTARQVGGDFFHFFTADIPQFGLVIGDVSGKGIPAALYMAAGITASDTLYQPNIQPGALLNQLNRTLYNRLHENKMNIALQIATFIPLDNPDTTASRMIIASAGMIAPIVANSTGCHLLPVGALPIGSLPTPEQLYTDMIFNIDPGTAVIFTSDGIVEARNGDGQLFGFERLKTTILEIIDTGTADAMVNHIITAVQNFTAAEEQADDMTVVVIIKQ
jgi:serine phosphatase RsbU (regulator of sigma subunit)/GTP-sensing pleiotropic transcriptional regulator CodY